LDICDPPKSVWTCFGMSSFFSIVDLHLPFGPVMRTANGIRALIEHQIFLNASKLDGLFLI
jgi:hypothetical protein